MEDCSCTGRREPKSPKTDVSRRTLMELAIPRSSTSYLLAPDSGAVLLQYVGTQPVPPFLAPYQPLELRKCIRGLL